MSVADGAPATGSPPRDRAPLRRRASIGAILLTGTSALRLGLQLAMLPILARLIGPTEYGLVAMAMPIILFANVVSDGGMSYALGRRQAVSPELEATVFWLSGGIGMALAAACALSAWPLAMLLHQPRLTPLIWALSPILVVNALQASSNAKIIREGRFTDFAGGDLLSTLAGAAVALTAATHGYGAWSLVAQQLVLWVVKFAWVFGKARAAVRLAFRWHEARDLIRFGIHAIGASVADYVSRNIDNMIVGGVLGSTALGYYAMAYQIVRVPDMLITGPLYLYIFTACARAAHTGDEAAVKELTVSAVRLAAATFAPLFCGLAIVAHLAVPLVLGDRWQGAILPLQWLAAAGFFFCICVVTNAILLGIGRSDLQLRLSLLLGAATIVIVGASASFGLPAVSAALACGIGLVAAIFMRQLARRLNMRRRVLAFAFAPAAAASALMAGGLMALRPLLEGMTPVVQLATLIAAGAALYAVGLAAVGRRRLLQDARAFLQAHGEARSVPA